MNDAELANYLKVSRRTLQEYRNNGILSYYQIGGKILYRESDIEELLEKKKNFLRKTDRKHSVKHFLEFSLIFKAKIRIFAVLTKSCISVQNKEVQSR